MTRSFTVIVFIVFFLIVGCSSDESEQNVSAGTLVVNVSTSDGTPEPNALVVLVPGNSSNLTNAEGIARFTDLAIGTYQVTVEVSIDSDSYVEGLIYEFNGITITENDTEILSVEVIDPIRPIEEIDPDVDLLLADTYKKLKDKFMFDLGGYSLYWGDIGADIAYIGNTASSALLSLDRYDISPSNTIINNVWALHYQVIRNTNIAIEAIENSEYVSQSGKEENVILGEFRFLRALGYFNLIKLYGNPVLVTSTDFDAPLTQNRTGVKELIEQDLKYAEDNLETYQSSKIASEQAAQSLLGKFYLYSAGFPDFDTGKYNLAAQQFEKVLNVFSLEEDYLDIFDENNEPANTEVIFSIDFDSSQENGGGNIGVFWGPLGYAQQDYLLLDPKFIRQYFNDENDYQNPITFPLNIEDERFYGNIASYTVQGGTTMDATDVTDWRPLKYITDLSTVPQAGASSVDFPYLRYADVLLMLAEVENALNGPTARAYDLVNQVIDRSDSSGVSRLPQGLNQSDFLLELFEQRRKELCFEGIYKDDLIRNELLSEVIEDFNLRNPEFPKQFESHEYIWPIPRSETDLNPNIVQNPGY
ncbi:RagB/SusD family nutrient uptake outer membrane protein [Allomuricauda sp. SCSIO 65647]|uniref:RagB/SusD family nutrient uptake outer membrane protein n=1 Tax=Allomuricauda sp. SCSIO 65647 TaxID=2908843 RepID=UPI001F2BBE88|nr:RagB/SusD family nutrient uptake outer membrane protein [Muricauda sp. SCSIO 65647]UJH68083.1 RagB/SusD family nutrient uptake outer membrane protein [Muricauda sp. SCSIO 65647]